MTDIYVLVREENDYNQHGVYYVHAWTRKPSREELEMHGCTHLGRVNNEDTWYELLKERAN